MDYELIKPDETHDSGAFLSYARGRQAAKQERDPDIGDTVHFWDMVEARCLAAVVTQDNLHTVELTVWPPGDGFRSVRERDVAHDETKTGPSWHWPCGGH